MVTDTCQLAAYYFLFVIHGDYGLILYSFRDKKYSFCTLCVFYTPIDFVTIGIL